MKTLKIEMCIVIALVLAIAGVRIFNDNTATAYASEFGAQLIRDSERNHDIVTISDEPVIYHSDIVTISDEPVLESDYYEDSSFMEKVSDAKYSSEDLKYMTCLLTGEGQTMSREGQILVGSVALNRVVADDYPDTLKGVCLDTKYGIQYLCFHDGNAYRTPTEKTEDIAKFLCENGSQIPSDVIYQAEFPQGSGIYAYVDGMYFCYR